MKGNMKKLIVIAALAFVFAGNQLIAAEPSLVGTSSVGGEFNGMRNTKKKYHITTNTTNTPVAANTTLYGVTINTSNAGTAWTLTIKDKEGTPAFFISALTLATTQNPTFFPVPLPGLVMIGGIDIVTAGTTPGVVDLDIAYK